MKTFHNIASAESFATGTLGIKTAKLGSDLALAQHVIAGLIHCKSLGAQLPPIVRIKTLDDGVIALLVPFAKPVLEINQGEAIFFSSARKFIAEGFVKSGPYPVILHEIGHYQHFRALGGCDPYLKVTRGRFDASNRKIARSVSFNASTDPCEFVAETFCGLSTGKKYSAAVLSLYSKYKGPAPL